MKKLLAPLFVMMSLVSHAQFNKGDKFIGGYSSFYTNKTTSSVRNETVSKSNAYALTIHAGFFINKNTAVGASVYGQTQQSSYADNVNTSTPYLNDQTIKSISTGVFIKRFFTITNKFLFALDGEVDYGRGIITTESSVNKTKAKNYNIEVSISPSFIFFPTPKWGIQASLGNLAYKHSKNITSNGKGDDLNLNLGTFSLGFSYYFRKNGE